LQSSILFDGLLKRSGRADSKCVIKLLKILPPGAMMQSGVDLEDEIDEENALRRPTSQKDSEQEQNVVF